MNPKNKIYDKDKHPKEFLALAAEGKSMQAIAWGWEISRETLYKWAKTYRDFGAAFEQAKQHWVKEIRKGPKSQLCPNCEILQAEIDLLKEKLKNHE
jgi:transposase-like protein